MLECINIQSSGKKGLYVTHCLDNTATGKYIKVPYGNYFLLLEKLAVSVE